MTERGDYISLWWPGAPIDADHFWSKPVLSFWIMSLSMQLVRAAPRRAGEMALVVTAPSGRCGCRSACSACWGCTAIYLCVSRFVSRRAGIFAAHRDRDLAALQPGGAAGDDRHGLRRPDDDGAGAGGAGAVRRRGHAAAPAHGPARPAAARLAATTRCFYLAVGLFAAGRAAAAHRQRRSSSAGPSRSGDHIYSLPGALVMLPYFAGFLAYFGLIGAAALQGAALSQHRRHAVRPGDAGQGDRRARPAGDRLSRPTWASPGTGSGSGARSSGSASCWRCSTCAVVAVPWHHAMLIRHGKPFWDELFGDNHWRRLVVGRHGDRGTFEYFLRELGYAVLPWIALAPAALAAMVDAAAGARAAARPRRGARGSTGSARSGSCRPTRWSRCRSPSSTTTSCRRSRAWRSWSAASSTICSRGATAATAAAAAVVGIPLLALVIVDLAFAPKDAQHFIWLFSYDYINTPQGRPWPPALDFRPALIAFAALFALATAALAWRRIQRGGRGRALPGWRSPSPSSCSTATCWR